MARAPDPRYCFECSNLAYVESMFCSLYRDNKGWVERARGDVKAAISKAKQQEPRQPFADRAIA
eukprot:10648983-Lingulodinium_polyedra.AAC.1